MISNLKPTSRKGGKSLTANQMLNIAEEETTQQTIDLEFLERMDFKEIEQMDPSCKDNFTVVFRQLVPCQMDLDYDTSSHYMQTNENIYFRILVQGEECRPDAIKLELTTDADV